MGVIGAAVTCVLAATLAAPSSPVAAVPGLPPAVPVDAPVVAPVEPLGPPTGNPYLGRAAAEGALAFGLSTLWYYRDPSLSVKDIDFTWSDTWHNRLVTFHAIRFDDNAFNINTILHPSSGVVLYLIARGNRLGPIPSFLLTVAASTLWEFLVEYREVASINDLIITPMAGVTIGEPLIRTAALLRAPGDAAGPVNRTLAAIFDPIGAFNRAFEPETTAQYVPTDVYGLPLEYRHRLSLAAGLAYVRFEGGRVRSEAQLASDLFVDATSALPSPGRRSELGGPGTLNYLAFEGNIAAARLSGARLTSTVAVVGRRLQYAQGPDEVSVSRGDDVFLGLATGFEYAFRSRPGMADDLLGVARLLGPLFDWGLRIGRFDLHFVADASYDFALVHALALTDYVTLAGTDALPKVLWQHGYYYAQGFSGSLRLLVRYGRWEGGADDWEDDLWIIRGRDRFLPIEPEPDARDRRALRRLWFAARFSSRLPFKVTVAGDQIAREGSLGSVLSRVSELRTAAMLGIGF